MTTAIAFGLLASTTGSYATVGREMVDGAMLAVEHFNRVGRVRLIPRLADPRGVFDAYATHAASLLASGRVRHLVGCYTSSSRKEVIPVVEKHDALLWYPSHYEGFESSENVVYLGAAPNQHVVPLAAWAMPRYGNCVYCVGSNYVWSWENTRIMRALVEDAGGTVVRERYLPVGDTDVEAVIRDVAALAPDFILNSAIGETSYAIYRGYQALGRTDARFAPARRPIVSCTLSEPEAAVIGPACEGHIACSVYFQSVDTPENERFLQEVRQHFGASRLTSADAEATYVTTMLLGRSLEEAGTDAIEPVRRALYGQHLSAPGGEVRVEPTNNHAWLTPRIGRARADGQFDVLWEAERPVRPDPYLSQPCRRSDLASSRPSLRLVSRR